MNKTTEQKIRFWSEIALSVITLVLALVFIIEVADIYYSGGAEIYTRAIVWGRLKKLIAPLVIWLVGVIACFVLSVIYPTIEKKKKTTPSERAANLRKRIPECDDGEFVDVKKQFSLFEKGRMAAYGLAIAFSAASAIIAIVYLADHSHFDSGEINRNILLLVRNVLPWIAASFLLFIAVAVYDFCVAGRELNLIGKMLVIGKGKPLHINPLAVKLQSAQAAAARVSDAAVWVARGAVLVLAAVFIGLGAANGGAKDVLYKAVNICTECIGLG